MNNNIKDAINKYIESKALAWSPSTMKSERARLGAVVEVLSKVGLDPAALYEELVKTHKPYTIKTLFTRLSNLELEVFGTAKFKTFKSTHARLFRNAYKKERVQLTMSDAVARINQLKDPAIKAKAFELLYSGMRYTESTTLKDGTVVGKGGKVRTVFVPITNHDMRYTGTYMAFWRALKAVGLKPHTLRKLRATNLIEQGASLPDLMEIMGWSSVQTASIYLQPKRQEELKTLMTKGVAA